MLRNFIPSSQIEWKKISDTVPDIIWKNLWTGKENNEGQYLLSQSLPIFNLYLDDWQSLCITKT